MPPQLSYRLGGPTLKTPQISPGAVARRSGGTQLAPQHGQLSSPAQACCRCCTVGASRTLLRAGNRPVLAVRWNGMRRPISRWVRAGSVVSFAWTRPGGGFGTLRVSWLPAALCCCWDSYRWRIADLLLIQLRCLCCAGLSYGYSRCRSR